MKKNLLAIYICTLFLCGCGNTPIFKYQNYTWEKNTTLGRMQWSDVYGSIASYPGGALAILNLDTDKTKTDVNVSRIMTVRVIFSPAVDVGAQSRMLCDKARKQNERLNYFLIYFDINKKNTLMENNSLVTYMFDASKVFLEKHGEKIYPDYINVPYIHEGGKVALGTSFLQAAGTLPKSIFNLANYSRFPFKTPFVCEELEDVIVEISGIYVNGVEAPPLKFKMNYENFIKKRWNK